MNTPQPADPPRMRRRTLAVAATWVAFLGVAATWPGSALGDPVEEPAVIAPYDCGYMSPDKALAEFQASVAAGLVPDPGTVQRPRARMGRIPNGRMRPPMPAGFPAVTAADIFPFEDSNDTLFSTNFSFGSLIGLMSQATNAVLAAHGDDYDFVAFWLNFQADHQIGAAFYSGLFNDVSGVGLNFSDTRAAFGVNSDVIQGWVMMWNQSNWSSSSAFTQLVLGQEFEHRFAMFIRPLSGNRVAQGNNGSCGRGGHWNFRVDGQGSGMEIPEWTGVGTLTRQGGTLNFSSDIGFKPDANNIGAVFSYPDLYLMGYVSPEELDTAPVELRYLDNNSFCSSPYSGTVSTWDSSDIIATNGPRNPDSTESQKHFRTAWVMIHRPSAPPTNGQLNNVVNILNKWTETYEWSTLGRGSMNNTLRPAFLISFPTGTPTSVSQSEVTTFEISATPVSNEVDLDSGLLHYAVDGGAFVEEPMVFLGGDAFEATLPAVPCGSYIEYFVTVDSTIGLRIPLPAAAPDEVLRAISEDAPLFADDFESDLGWTVENSAGLIDGAWQSGVPVEGGGSNAPTVDFDFSGQCFLTANEAGDSDVDGGTTTLLSPELDLSTLSDPQLYYARWFNNSTPQTSQDDVFVVEISDDGGDSWVVLETVGPTPADLNPEVDGGWFFKSFRIAQFVEITDRFRIRFIASDLGVGSRVEAGVDAVAVVDCVRPPVCDDLILNQGESRIDCGGPCAACECLSDPTCDDGAFCNGAESCSAFGACVSAGDPCDEICLEATNECVECVENSDCDDGVMCTVDACGDGLCDHVATAALCDNGVFCDGAEACDAELGCQAGAAACAADRICDEGGDRCVGCLKLDDCVDEFDCTTDNCVDNECQHITDDDACDDGAACNGAEFCDSKLGCLNGAELCPGEQCIEDTQACEPPGALTCRLSRGAALPGQSVTLELFAQNVFGVSGYEFAITATRVAGDGSLLAPCPDGVAINTTRSDYLFFGALGSVFAIPDCAGMRGAVASQTVVVDAGPTRAYLGEYELTVSDDATLGSQFEIQFAPSPGTLFLAPLAQAIPVEFGEPCVLEVAECEEFPFGDVNFDGEVNIFDIFCVLDGFQGVFSTCAESDVDLVCGSGCCGSDGTIDLLDIFAVLDGFTGTSQCAGPCVSP